MPFVPLFVFVVMVGLVKVVTSNSMVFTLLGIEMVTCSMFILSLILSPVGGEGVSSSTFLSLCVMEGVVGLVILVNMFRTHPSSGSWSILL